MADPATTQGLLLAPLAFFLFAASITPGPNNVMLAASGMNFGYRRSLPHVAGVAAGFGALMFACALGFGALYERHPEFRAVLSVVGGGYLLYLAWRIATAGPSPSGGGGRPLRFHEAAAFQVVNPKAWVMALTASGSFLPALDDPLRQALVVLAVVLVIGVPCMLTWTLFGQAMARLFTTPGRRRVVNGALALLLVASLPLIVL